MTRTQVLKGQRRKKRTPPAAPPTGPPDLKNCQINTYCFINPSPHHYLIQRLCSELVFRQKFGCFFNWAAWVDNCSESEDMRKWDTCVLVDLNFTPGRKRTVSAD